MQKFNYHSHTYRCGHADLDMKDEDYKDKLFHEYQRYILQEYIDRRGKINDWQRNRSKFRIWNRNKS